jgi:hypothetical protein
VTDVQRTKHDYRKAFQEGSLSAVFDRKATELILASKEGSVPVKIVVFET